MRERGRSDRFTYEPMPSIRIPRDLLGQQLDRDLAAQRRIVCEIHLAHSASAEAFENAVAADGSGLGLQM
jgi:hypothetical protein